MQYLTSIAGALSAISTFCVQFGAKLPADVQTILTGAAGAPSPVDAIIGATETLYAAQGAITDAATQTAARTLAGQLAQFATLNGWHGYSGGRGSGILQAMQRDLGETAPAGTAWPEASADPAINEAFAPAPAIVADPVVSVSTSASLSTSASSSLSTSASTSSSLSTSASTST
jgi:hypothetical protein